MRLNSSGLKLSIAGAAILGTNLWNPAARALESAGTNPSTTINPMPANGSVELKSPPSFFGLPEPFTPPDTAWTQLYGYSNDDFIDCVQQAPDGGFYLVGSTHSDIPGDPDDRDLWLVRTSPTGEFIWDRSFGGSQDDKGADVQVLSDGGLVIAGETRSEGAGSLDAWVIRTDSQGIEVWSKTYGGSGYDAARSIIPLADGGFLVAGEYYSGPYDQDGWWIRIDSQGQEIWSSTYRGSGMDTFQSAADALDGGFIAAGYTYESGFPAAGWAIKIDINGNTLWEKTYGDTKGSYFEDVIRLRNGDLAFAGYALFEPPSTDGWLIRTDADGAEIWRNSYGGDFADRLSGLQETVHGGLVSAGVTSSYGDGDQDLWVHRTDSLGVELWSQALGNTGQESGRGIASTTDGAYVAFGFNKAPGSYNYDGWVLRFKPECAQPSFDRPPGPEPVFAGDISEDQWIFESCPGRAGLFSLQWDCDWLDFSPAEGYIPADSSIQIAVSYDASSLHPEDYLCDVHITWDDSITALEQITLSVLSPLEVERVQEPDSIFIGDIAEGRWLLRNLSDQQDLSTFFDATCPWLDLSPPSTLIPPNSDVQVSLTYDTQGLLPGESECPVAVIYHDSLEVTLDVEVSIVSPVSVRTGNFDSSVRRGERQIWDFELANDTPGFREIDVWFDAYLIGDAPYAGNPFDGPYSGRLGPYYQAEYRNVVKIPSNAPLGGPYRICTRAGIAPDQIWTEDCFEFSVAP